MPRSLSAQELIKALARYGYQSERQKGSHIRLTTAVNGEHHLTIPNHNPLRIGTLSAILNDVANHVNKTKEEVIDELFG
ncbi:type II toxin-antitoxin system HicA family toxin [Flavisolibacter ginsenosidimutans]|nr:type II toxin-antitoxin system HicA family toxin [Flavisolibacter ginsenosidimutans]